MKNKVAVAITGVTGNMGEEVMRELAESGIVSKYKVVIYKDKKWKPFLKRYSKMIEDGVIEILYGSIANRDICRNLVSDVIVLGGKRRRREAGGLLRRAQTV